MLMLWLLNLIPNFIVHLIVVLSILSLVATQFFSFIPFIGRYLLPIKIISIITLVFSVYLEGAVSSNDLWQSKLKDAEIKTAQAETLAAETNTKLTKIILENEQYIYDITITNRKELEKVSAQLNKQCKVNPVVIDVLNNAAKNQKENKK